MFSPATRAPSPRQPPPPSPCARCRARWARSAQRASAGRRSWGPSQLLRSLQGHQRDVVLLLPVLAGEAGELGEEEADQRRAPRAVGPHQALQPREAEHLAPLIVRLDETVAVEQDALALLQNDLLLLVGHPRHEPERHPRRP